MFFMVVVPGVVVARIANVITRSGVAFMSISPNDLRLWCAVILIVFFWCEMRQPMFLRW